MLRRRLTTDRGTALLHLGLLGSFIWLLVTGLRIASDDPQARWVAVLDPVLPMENIWFWHLVAALLFTCLLVAYAVYVIKARLTPRVRFDRARVIALANGGKARWLGFNALVHWSLMTSFVILLATGTMLFLDLGGAATGIHLSATWAALGLVALHVAAHALIGGVPQLLRIVRPVALTIAPPPPDFAALLAEHLGRQPDLTPHRPAPRAQRRERWTPAPPRRNAEPASGPGAMTLHAHPAVSALIAAALMSTAAIGLESATRPVLQVARIAASQVPTIDGELSDPAWLRARPATVVTTHGGDFGGTGQSTIEVRALHDGDFAYFAFVWSDPTRSLKHHPLVKTEAGWSLVATDRSGADENRFYEDKFAALFTLPTLPLIGAAIHLSPAPLPDAPPSATGRGLHYTTNGGLADLWVWRATHEGSDGHVDNCHFGPPREPTEDQRAGRARYAGGYAVDPGPKPYRPNVMVKACPADGRHAGGKETLPMRLPRDPRAQMRSLGRITDSSHQSETEGARWWLSQTDSVPYSKAIDDRIPVGTVIPGLVMKVLATADPTGLLGRARWAAGRWTLEIKRRRQATGDHDLALDDGAMMWLAAFDHSQTRHTRHLRPFTLEFEE